MIVKNDNDKEGFEVTLISKSDYKETSIVRYKMKKWFEVEIIWNFPF